MRLSTRLFLCLFAISTSLGLALLLVTKHYVKSQARSNYVARYIGLSSSLGHTLNQLEENAEGLMYAAARVVVAEDDRTGLLSDFELKRLRDDLKITHIFVTDRHGRFIRSTNEAPNLIPNLFSFCPRYAELITGASSRMGTPIIPPTPEPNPYKFLTLPNSTHTRLIEVGLRVDFIGATLSRAIATDRNIVDLSLFAPDGTALGRFNQSGFQMARGKTKLPANLDTVTETGDSFELLTRVASSQPHCCQCEVSGIDDSGEYYYLLKTHVSKQSLTRMLAAIDRFFALVLALVVTFSLLASQLLSRLLLARLEQLVRRLQEIKQSRNLSERVQLAGNDEIAELAQEFDALLETLSKAQEELVSSKRHSAILELARQVSHDIRSPLAALAAAERDLSALPEDTRILIRSAIRRIRDIATQLLDRNRTHLFRNESASALEALPEKQRAYLLSLVIDAVVSEKRLQLRPKPGIEIEINIGAPSYGIFVNIQLTEFKRALSNLINNAVEALPGYGQISIEVISNKSTIAIFIRDNGKGIPQQVLSTLMKPGTTFQKAGGSGLGLFHAKRTIESWQGSLNLESKEGVGTTAIIKLPQTPAPNWFVRSIKVTDGMRVVVIDDDESIHQIWKNRFESLASIALRVELNHFYSVSELKGAEQMKERASKETLYLFDYEIAGETHNGLDVIEELEISQLSILVTSHYEDEFVITRCSKLGVPLIPKSMAGFVPLDLPQGSSINSNTRGGIVTHIESPLVGSNVEIPRPLQSLELAK